MLVAFQATINEDVFNAVLFAVLGTKIANSDSVRLVVVSPRGSALMLQRRPRVIHKGAIRGLAHQIY